MSTVLEHSFTNDSAHDIPIIDIGPLRDGSAQRRVAEEIVAASRDIGFLYVSNHGVSEAFLDRMREVGLGFFRQPLEKKLEVSINEKHRGFLKIGAARMHDGALPDLKESFVWGCDADPADIAVGIDNPFRGDNQWPSFAPSVHLVAKEFSIAVSGVAHQLLRAFAIGLRLPEGTFLNGSERPMSRGSLTYYPPGGQSKNASQFGVAPHTDFGVLTVLRQDHVGGLEVQDRNGNWIAAAPVPGTFVVNVGDLLERWTDGTLRSTPHRVVNRSGEERLSLVFAYDPDFGTMIDPAVMNGGQPTRQNAISCGDYLLWRFKKAFDYRK